MFIEILESQPRRQVRGQYSKESAKLYIKAAKSFPHVHVRKIATEGEVCFVEGGSFKVLDGCVALEFSGRSNNNPNSPFESFYKKFEELKEKKQNSLLSKIKKQF